MLASGGRQKGKATMDDKQQAQRSGGQQQDRSGKVLNTKPISIQFVDSPLDIRDALHDLTPLLDGSAFRDRGARARTSGVIRVELTAPTPDGEYLDCSIYTETDDDRSKVIEWLATRRIEVTDEGTTRHGSRSHGDENRDRNRNG